MDLIKRALGIFPLLLLISFLAFSLMRVAPGGPFDKERKPASPEIERLLKEKYHLDRSLLVQYGHYLKGLLKGDFGPSTKYRNHSVNDIIAQGLPISLTLGGMAFVFALGLGIPLGAWSAWHRGRWQDHLGSFFALLSVCVPGVILGPILVLFFAVQFPVFPVALWESFWHMVLPTLALGLYFAGKIARLAREGFTETLAAPFILTARAKGVSPREILFRHAFKLSILPVVSYSGPLLADLLIGSFVVENLFQIPGIGVFLVNSSMNRDYPMIMGLVILYAVLLLVLNLVVDVLYRFLDPRTRPLAA